MGSLDGEQKQMIKKLVNFRMKEGKRTRVHAIVYQTFHSPARIERVVIKLMVDAIENIKPICEVEKIGVAAFKRRISYRISLEKCSFAKILDAYRKRGIAHKKRENLHGLASTNRSFAHFKWWTPPFAKMCFYIVSFGAQVVESLKVNFWGQAKVRARHFAMNSVTGSLSLCLAYEDMPGIDPEIGSLDGLIDVPFSCGLNKNGFNDWMRIQEHKKAEIDPANRWKMILLKLFQLTSSRISLLYLTWKEEVALPSL
ncbi:hypothetical protein SADUNF_Sadunf18G0054500 [Salix dunnii]|uniref:Small ribosomal subunit protein uS7 domain-containing protein n=1 Tax=Salix dunnii TaxID=1413687 RepID=A0A835MDQ1_9ROSI|nr:hypothetical protein SADUNF_Sadunf18G0054500 [Salix dunnii]